MPEDAIARILERLQKMEDTVHELVTKTAVNEIHRNNVEKRLSGIERNLNRLVWLIIGALGVAAIEVLLALT